MKKIIILCFLLLAGCDGVTGQMGDTYSNLPIGATSVRTQGNGWYTFEWEGRCFLTHTSSAAAFSTYDRVLTQIDCKND